MKSEEISTSKKYCKLLSLNMNLTAAQQNVICAEDRAKKYSDGYDPNNELWKNVFRLELVSESYQDEINAFANNDSPPPKRTKFSFEQSQSPEK